MTRFASASATIAKLGPKLRLYGSESYSALARARGAKKARCASWCRSSAFSEPSIFTMLWPVKHSSYVMPIARFQCQHEFFELIRDEVARDEKRFAHKAEIFLEKLGLFRTTVYSCLFGPSRFKLSTASNPSPISKFRAQVSTKSSETTQPSPTDSVMNLQVANNKQTPSETSSQ